MGFGLRNRDHGGYTAGGAGNTGGLPAKYGLLRRTGGYLGHRVLFLCLRYGTPDWEKGGKKGLKQGAAKRRAPRMDL